eukprot:988413-Pyramimonas_sp.AAC.1
MGTIGVRRGGAPFVSGSHGVAGIASFSAPRGVRRKWSLSAASIRFRLAGRGRRSMSPKPHGVLRRWFKNAVCIRL